MALHQKERKFTGEIIENMDDFVCPKCGAETDIFKTGGGQKISEEVEVPFLGRIPLDPRICDSKISHSYQEAAVTVISQSHTLKNFNLQQKISCVM